MFRPSQRLGVTLVFLAASACGACNADVAAPAASAASGIPGPSLSAAAAAAPTVLASALAPNVCADVSGNQSASGKGVIIQPCDGTRSQQFTLTSANRITVWDTMCVDLANASGADTTRVIIRRCSGTSTTQVWTPAAPGADQQIKAFNGKCLDVYGSKPTSGTRLILWPCHGGADMKWTFRPYGTTPTPPPPPPSDVTFTLNTATRHAVSRFIYGVNGSTDDGGAYAGGFPWYGATPPRELTLNRFGGNRLTAFNWENNYSNAGSDYNFQNDGFLHPSTTTGEAVRSRAVDTFGRNSALMVTVPMLGYVAANGNGTRLTTTDHDRAGRLATHFVQSRPFKGSALSLTPNKADGVVYQDEFVNWVDKTFPGAKTDPLKPIFYSLDNEPDSWHPTHKEIQSDLNDNPNTPRLQTYDGFIGTSVDYARAVKSVVPNGLVFGPATATWAGMATLGRWPSPDPVHGSRFFLDVYLEKFRAAESTHGRRLLDVLDIHWYPAAGTSAGEISNDYATQDAAMVQARLQAPRSLWDPSYNEGSWVNDAAGGPVRLLPRLRETIAARYPGTKIAITEYYYGRTGDISGGVTQADVLGIFGREGVYAAAFWPIAGVHAAPYAGSGAKAYAYAFGAFRMFLNYDGAGGRFGDTGVSATTSDHVNSSVYASLDANNNVVVIAINKASAAKVASVRVTHPTALKTARVFTLTGAAPGPQRQADVAVGAGNVLTYTMPAMSVSTLVLVP